jgi:hypothetical protein
MDPAAPLVIHEVLATEILAIIFEEHAKLEWRAPAIDGRVCRIWRQIVLNTPRAWAYLKISGDKPPSIGELRLWLLRSGTAPLHIRFDRRSPPGKVINKPTLCDLLGENHVRVVSLWLRWGEPAIFEGRDFPCLRFLDIMGWYPTQSTLDGVRWDSMPKLQSLHSNGAGIFSLPWSELARLKVLNFSHITLSSTPNQSQSLTTLMFDDGIVDPEIRGPIDLPSLTYLSLNNMIRLKPHLNVPSLVTYHEGWSPASESFPAPIPSLVEYGVEGSVDHKKWHRDFPNVSRLAIRARPLALISSLRSLCQDPHLLPKLQAISVRTPHELLTEEERETIASLVRGRSEACDTDLALYFEKEPPYQIPLFFGTVRHCLSKICEFLTVVQGPGTSLVKDVKTY